MKWINRLYATKYWWTFGELFGAKALASTNPIVELSAYFTDSTTDAGWKKFFDNSIAYNYWGEFCDSSDTTKLKPYLLELLKLLFARYYDHYVFCSDDEYKTNGELLNDNQFNMFLVKLINIVNFTYSRYATLLKAYNDEADNLMNGVKTISDGTGRFNDTPQNEEVDGVFVEDKHTTNLTNSHAEVVTDVSTKIDRLNEIQQKYRNLIKDWLNEFDGLFLEEGNL